MADDILVAIACVDGRLEYLNLLAGYLRTLHAADKLLCLAREHRATYHLYAALAAVLALGFVCHSFSYIIYVGVPVLCAIRLGLEPQRRGAPIAAGKGAQRSEGYHQAVYLRTKVQRKFKNTKKSHYFFACIRFMAYFCSQLIHLRQTWAMPAHIHCHSPCKRR